MKDTEKFPQYKKDDDYSYSQGAFPTFELLINAPDLVTEIIVSDTFTDMEKLYKLCSERNVEVIVNNKLCNKLSDKENCFVIGRFKKRYRKLRRDRKHIVLVNPGNMGNLGTILRTALAFHYEDIAVIAPNADVFNPKTVRASMGAVFSENITIFKSFEEYMSEYPEHELYCFMLQSSKILGKDVINYPSCHSLVFGNESSGLPDSFMNYGTNVIIEQSDKVDSLNITIAVGIACYEFSKGDC
ncbi:MAG: TrmH family RNA methyltransferase [Lachnospiraceae bacterium]|nr:TrmH family RNA methyltransferase [Lachnospiraceae bacterium]